MSIDTLTSKNRKLHAGSSSSAEIADEYVRAAKLFGAAATAVELHSLLPLDYSDEQDSTKVNSGLEEARVRLRKADEHTPTVTERSQDPIELPDRILEKMRLAAYIAQIEHQNMERLNVGEQ